MVLRSGIALSAGFIVLMVLARFPIPPLAIYVVLVAGGLALRRRKPTAGLLVVGISTILVLVLSLAPMVDNLRRPGDPIDFTLAVLGWAAAVCTAVGGRGRGGCAGAGRQHDRPADHGRLGGCATG